MPPTANRPALPATSPDVGISGKWIIVGVLAVALFGAGTSWWFRYLTTHRTAQFWGPRTARLIRDAPHIRLFRVGAADGTAPAQPMIPLGSGGMLQVFEERDVSRAGGIAHLRNALIEDRSFDWPARPVKTDSEWAWALIFMRARTTSGSSAEPSWIGRITSSMHDDKDVEWAGVLFTEDCSQAMLLESADDKIISCAPIAAGLREVFAEFMKLPESAP